MKKAENIIYFYYKVSEALLISKRMDVVLSTIDRCIVLDPISVLEILENVLRIYNNTMTADMKKNAYNIIEVFTERLKETNEFDKVEIVNMKNKLVSMVNSSNDSEMEMYLASQLYTRLMNEKLNRKAMRDRNAVMASVQSFIINDLNLLITHSSVYDDETFMSIYTEYSTQCLDYMASISAILAEQPNYMDEELFKKRVNLVLSGIDKNISFETKEEKKIYKTLIKKIHNS